jgi:hypothetical protein
MTRDDASRSLHRLIAEAVARGERMKEESRLAIAEIHASTDALARTVAAVHRGRAERRTFGNRHADAQEDSDPGYGSG